MSKEFKKYWDKLEEPSTTLSKSDKQKINKEIFKAAMEKESSPWAICTASVGRESAKYEDCVMDVKGTLGIDKEMKEEEYGKDVNLDYAGPDPKSGLAEQDLEGDTHSTTKPEENVSDDSKEKEDVSGPLPNRTNL
jgi:hypothetical protein